MLLHFLHFFAFKIIFCIFYHFLHFFAFFCILNQKFDVFEIFSFLVKVLRSNPLLIYGAEIFWWTWYFSCSHYWTQRLCSVVTDPGSYLAAEGEPHVDQAGWEEPVKAHCIRGLELFNASWIFFCFCETQVLLFNKLCLDVIFRLGWVYVANCVQIFCSFGDYFSCLIVAKGFWK